MMVNESKHVRAVLM